MPSIFGSMVVKNGIKQVIYNFSNARKKTYAQVQAMSDAEKQGVIICDDYPVDSAYGTYEKIADGTTLNELKTLLSGMSQGEHMATRLVVTANDLNGGTQILYPNDSRSNIRQYKCVTSPFNASYYAYGWFLTYNSTADVISYTESKQPANGTYSSTTPTVSSWELYRLKV